MKQIQTYVPFACISSENIARRYREYGFDQRTQNIKIM